MPPCCVHPCTQCPCCVHIVCVVCTVSQGYFLGGFSVYYCIRKSKVRLFPAVNFNLVGRPQPSDTYPTMWGHLYGILASPDADHALILSWPEEEFGAQEASGCSSPNFGEGGRGNPAQIFKFLLKSISGVFSNVVVKCEFILIKLTGWNNWFSFWNFHHFLKVYGFCHF